MASRGKKVVNPNDPARFAGNGLNYRAKLIGIETVPEARGDEMCQETITKLKNSVKISGQHKPKIFVQVTLEGLKIIDAISLIVLHTHAVHRISFIARDVTDNRAFGYVYGEGDGTHTFFAIKTAAAAEQLVLALRDLFQVVYEMKKKEMEKIELENTATNDGVKAENSQDSGDGSTLSAGQALVEKVSAEGENIYQVPPNNAPVNPPTQAEQVANLLDLEDQADHILKDIEQIKNLEFDSLSSDPAFSPTSPPTAEMANLSLPASSGIASLVDPWGLSPSVGAAGASPAVTATSLSSALGDLAGLQTGPFSPLGQNPFQPSPFSVQPGLLSSPTMNMMGGSLPVSRDPFGSDPFGSSAQPRLQQTPGFGAAPNPFGAGGFAPQFGMPPVANSQMTAGLMPGMVPHGFLSQPGMMGTSVPPMGMGGVRNPFSPTLFASPQPQMGNLFGEDEPNVLKPMKKDGSADVQNTESTQAKQKTRDDLFGDLLDIKKSTPAVVSNALSPKDLFNQGVAVEKKSLNALKSTPKPAQPASAPQVQASDSFDCPPLGDNSLYASDEANGPSFSGLDEEDPLASSCGPPAIDPPSCPDRHLSDPFVSSTPPPVPQRHISPSFTSEKSLNSESKILASFVLNSPPIPSRTKSKSKYSDNANVKPSLSPLVLNITNDNTSLILPSPDEPPPPLPPHLLPQLTPPDPPPRPIFSSSSFTSSSSSFSEINYPLDTLENNLSNKLSNSSLNIDDKLTNHGIILYDAATENAFSNDSLGSFIQDSSVSGDLPTNNMFSVNFDNDQKTFPVTPFEDNAPFIYVREDSGQFSVVNKENSSLKLTEERMSCDESDPFNIPLHLTPAFKVVAKFGSDPFDDSFNSLRNDKWDPFAASEPESYQEKDDFKVQPSAFDPFNADPLPGNTTPSPAFNAFGVPSQPPSGSTSGNSLLD
ncbi:hypothetical protein Btru_040408 [Bulinus truncatus]|nr:hypothetical protein Btru_040408 [Bulinus truncatus]